MKTKNLIILIITVVLFFHTAYSQSKKSTLGKLMGKAWQLQTSTDLSNQNTIYFNEYKSDTIFSTIMFAGEKHIVKSLYYLSNQVEPTFDRNKVGKKKDGKYIIFTALLYDEDNNLKKTGITNVVEIIELNENELKFKNIESPHITPFKAAVIPETYDLSKKIKK